MERPLQYLYPLISRRFQSFAEASDASLDILAAQVPGEIVLGQIDPGADQLRVLDVRGASIVGVERGNMLPLAKVIRAEGLGPSPSVLEGTAGLDDLDAAHLQAIGLSEWIALPLEMSDGAIVGIVAALSRRQGDYGAEHLVLLGLISRMLAYEWERVQTRTELRELRRRLDAVDGADGDTGMPDRAQFVDLLDRAWKLARRGTVGSMAVCFRVDAGDEAAGSAGAVRALSDAAAALAGAIRSTDEIGRIAEMELGVLMIGCEDTAEVEALARRFADGLHRVTHGRAVKLSVAHGAVALADAVSATDAIERAEAALHAPQAR